ncbi:MAG TPA: hypothetical protein DCX89_00760 [Saprospirales bacterium]|nr:hypothetical protein [Saprospirales bacterium]
MYEKKSKPLQHLTLKNYLIFTGLMMKRIILYLFAGFLCTTASGQFTEFIVDKEGLLYCHYTINRLTGIVDSLNTQFSNSGKKSSHYSKPQTIGYAIRMEKGDIEKAMNDIADNISFEKFIKKYSTAKFQKDVLIVRNKYLLDDKDELIEYLHLDVKNGNSYSFYPDKETLESLRAKETHWVFEYQPRTKHLKGYLKAIYIPQDFETIEIPDNYAEMISYAVCMTDTTHNTNSEKTREGWIALPDNWLSLSIDSMKVLLDSLRKLKVLGTCSLDSRPQQHAFNIALLSAETANWQVFIKAHLDIMNYRFERRYGPTQLVNRNTYIKELEELKINVPDLLLGISFRTENPGYHHYFPSIGMVENVLYESQNRTEIEEQILTIIGDDELDDYNRLIFYLIFKDYILLIRDDKSRKAYEDKLMQQSAKLPHYLQVQIAGKKKSVI